MHIDMEYISACIREPSMALRDWRWWRKRKGVRFARPKVRKFVSYEQDIRDGEAEQRQYDLNTRKIVKRGLPLLGLQEGAADLLASDEDEDEADKGKKKVEKRRQLEKGTLYHMETIPEEDEDPAVDSVGKTGETEAEKRPGQSIGRKEAKRGAKKRKNKR
jgi:hypothetical protein